MQWPWVSRTAYDLLIDERDRLRENNDQFQDLFTRVARKQEGLPEVPRKPKVVDTEPMPVEVREYLEAFGSTEMRNNLEEDISASRSQGTPWSEIMRMILASEDKEDVQPEAD